MTDRTLHHPSATSTTPAGPTDSNDLRSLVNRVFTRLEAMWPRQFRTQFESRASLDYSRRELLTGLQGMHVPLTVQTVDAAMERIKQGGRRYPPPVPELLQLLMPMPADIGWPQADEAWRSWRAHALDDRMPAPDHAAVINAGAYLSSWDVQRADHHAMARLERDYRSEYRALLYRALRGEPITPQGRLAGQGRHTPFEQAVAAGKRVAHARACDQGLDRPMTATEALAAMRRGLDGRR